MSRLPLFILSCATLLLVGLAACSPRPHTDGVVLATVNGDVITADEFRLNYEFGHGHLRSGAIPREDYLRFLILEQVLAQEARRMRLDTTSAVVHAMHTLREELLIERVFEEHVLADIQVTDADIAAAINEDAVRFQFRFLLARSHAEAVQLQGLAETQGFAATRDALEQEFSDLGHALGEIESPVLSADEIEPDVLAVLKDLPLETVSDPVEYRGGWYLFQVTNIQREPLSPEDYALRASSYQKVVYSRKAMEKATAFVSQLMEPMEVVTRREGFILLSDALWMWYSRETPVRNLLHYLESGQVDPQIARRLTDGYSVSLVAFDSEVWTIQTFLEHFTLGRYVLRACDRESFDQRLANIVALVVRDYILLTMAQKE